MRAVLTAMMVLLVSQESDVERRIADLVRGLGQESLDAREQAANGLLALGPKAIATLKRTSDAEPDGDVKARMLAVLKALEERARREQLGGTATHVSLKADGMRLSDVVAELNRQAATKIALPEALADERVSVSFTEVPFLEALERVCRAHKNVTFRLSGGVWMASQPPTPIALGRGEHAGIARLVKGQFVVELAAISTIRESDFSTVTKRQLDVEIRLLWEQGTRPLGASVRVTSLVDDQGKSYVEAQEPSLMGGDSGTYVPKAHFTRFGALLPPEVKRLRELAGEVEFRFPLDEEVLRVADPLGKRDVAVKGELLEFGLSSLVRDGRSVKAKLTGSKSSNLLNHPFLLVDKSGKVYSSVGGALNFGSDRLTADLDYVVPLESEVVELRVTIPKPGAAQVLPFRFENVRLRQGE